MADAITDEMLDVYAVTATWDELPRRLVEKYHGTASRLVFYFADEAWKQGPEQMKRWQDVIRRTRALDASRSR